MFLASTGTDVSGSIASQTVPLVGPKVKKSTAAEGSLPWRRERQGMAQVAPLASIVSLYRVFVSVKIDIPYAPVIDKGGTVSKTLKTDD